MGSALVAEVVRLQSRKLDYSARTIDEIPGTSDNSQMSIGRRVRYFGRVQGVGFRYTARSLAARFAVAGYVRNLPDGTVELLAEGEPAEIDAFLQALAQRLQGYVERTEITDEINTDLKDFTIRY
jgi:acylphosphatase